MVRNTDLGSSLCGSSSNQDGQEVHDYQEGDNCNFNEDKQYLSGADEEQKGKEICIIMLYDCGPAIESPTLMIKDEMQVRFTRLLFSQTSTQELVEDQGADSPRALASLSDDNITAICDLIRKSGSIVSGKMTNMGNQIFTLAKNLKLTMLMFKTIECCSKPYDVNHVNSRNMLAYQH